MLRIVVRKSRLLPDGNLFTSLVTIDLSAPNVEALIGSNSVSEDSYEVAEVIGAMVIKDKSRPVGRPRKSPSAPTVPGVKRPRGRPRKVSPEISQEQLTLPISET